jgi:hypothetical protein
LIIRCRCRNGQNYAEKQDLIYFEWLDDTAFWQELFIFLITPSCYGPIIFLKKNSQWHFFQIKWWAVTDAITSTKFEEIELFFWRPCKISPLFGYYLEPTKSNLIGWQHNLEADQLQFPDFKVRTGNRYLGGFTGRMRLSTSGSGVNQILGGSCDWSDIKHANLFTSCLLRLAKLFAARAAVCAKTYKGNWPQVCIHLANCRQDLSANSFLGDGYDNEDPRRALADPPPSKVGQAGNPWPHNLGAAKLWNEHPPILCSHILAAFGGVDVFRSTDHLKVTREVKAKLKLRNVKSESSLNDCRCTLYWNFELSALTSVLLKEQTQSTSFLEWFYRA